MPTPITLAGVTYDIPSIGENNWQDVTDMLIAIPSAALTRSGGNFSLTGEIDLGATFGTKQVYLKTQTADSAAAGLIRLAKSDTVSFRNNANDGDLALAIDASDNLTYDGTVVSLTGHSHSASDISSGTFDNARMAESNITQHSAALFASPTLTGTTTLPGSTEIDSNGYVGINFNPNGVPAAIKGLISSSGSHGLELVTYDSSSDFKIGIHDSGGSAGRSIIFARGGSKGMDTESMRINSSGRVGINTTNPTVLLQVKSGNSDSDGIVVNSDNTGGDGRCLELLRSSSVGGGHIIINNGNGDAICEFLNSGGVAFKAGGTSWTAISDEALKKNFAPITDARGKLRRTNPTHFEYKNSGKNLHPTGTRTGWKAQDFQKEFPGHVTTRIPSFEEDRKLLAKEGRKEALVMEPDLAPYFAQAITDNEDEIIQLQTKITNLITKIESLGK